MILSQRVGEFLAVTEVSQFLLPAYIHIRDLRGLVYYEQSRDGGGGQFGVDFATFHRRAPAPPVEKGLDTTTRDQLANDLADWLKLYGVRVEGGTYFRTDVCPFVK